MKLERVEIDPIHKKGIKKGIKKAKIKRVVINLKEEGTKILHRFRSGEPKEIIIIEKEQFYHVVYRDPGIKKFERWFPRRILTIQSAKDYKEIGKYLQKWAVRKKVRRLDGPAVIDYDKNGQKDFEEWKPSRKDGPSRIRYENKIKTFEIWMDEKGEAHREGAPARILYFRSGKVYYEGWYCKGKLHREDGPAEISYTKKKSRIIQELFYKNDKPFKKGGGPTKVEYFPSGKIKREIWQMNSNNQKYNCAEHHRLGKPAVKVYNKEGEIIEESYYQNGELHREGSSAFIKYNIEAPKSRLSSSLIWEACKGEHVWSTNTKEIKEFFSKLKSIKIWFNKGKKHRIDGPAIVYDLGEGEQKKYYVNDEEPTGAYLLKFLLATKKARESVN